MSTANYLMLIRKCIKIAKRFWTRKQYTGWKNVSVYLNYYFHLNVCASIRRRTSHFSVSSQYSSLSNCRRVWNKHRGMNFHWKLITVGFWISVGGEFFENFNRLIEFNFRKKRPFHTCLLEIDMKHQFIFWYNKF